jgi:hypothetical protein
MQGLREPMAIRFWRFVRKTDECWFWTGTIGSRGYGEIQGDGSARKYRAHRASWIIHNGDIPDGLWVLHRCDVRNCVRPDHLWLGTAADNSADMLAKGRAGRPGLGRIGEAAPGHKLTPDMVRSIRALLAEGRMTQKAIGAKFGVSKIPVRDIARGTRWAHIP